MVVTSDDSRLSPRQCEDAIEQYRRLAWKLAYGAAKRFNMMAHADDIHSEIELAFVVACRTFKKDHGPIQPGLGFYLRRAGERAANLYCRMQLFHGFCLPAKTYRSETPPNIDVGGDVLAECLAVKAEQCQPPRDQDEWWSRICSPLSDRQKRIVVLTYREGKNQSEIARELGVSQAAVWKILKVSIEALSGLQLADYSGDHGFNGSDD